MSEAEEEEEEAAATTADKAETEVGATARDDEVVAVARTFLLKDA